MGLHRSVRYLSGSGSLTKRMKDYPLSESRDRKSSTFGCLQLHKSLSVFRSSFRFGKKAKLLEFFKLPLKMVVGV